jgi:hypothetical protein
LANLDAAQAAHDILMRVIILIGVTWMLRDRRTRSIQRNPALCHLSIDTMT